MKHLRHLITAMVLLMSLTMTAQTEYRFNQEASGFSAKGKSGNTLTIHHNVSAITLEESDREGLEGQHITLSGIHISNQAGAPDLPSGSTSVAIPNGATPTLRLVSAKTKTLHDVDLIPAPEPQLDDDNSPAVYQKDMSIYGRDAFYPATPYTLSEVSTVRGVEMVQVGVMPFQYNPVTKELLVYEDMELELSTEGGDGSYGDLRYRTPEWDQILSDMLLNREVLPEVDYGERLRKHYENRETGCQYIIITPDNEDFVQLADSIRKFRTEQGIPTEVYTVSQCGGNTGSAIRNFIRNAYNNWDMPPAAVLILGDHNADPTVGVVSYTMNNHPGGDGYNPYISDHAYSVMDYTQMPDIIMGRITGRDYDELYHMIKKDLDYERTPPTNPKFYDEPVTAMGYQLERWFQLCSEVVNGFWEYELGKHPVRINAIYQGTPGSRWSTNENTPTVLSYFGPNGCGYIPSTMSHLTDWSGTGQKVNDAINSGAFILQHRDHGAEELWGEPGYSINHIKRLANEDLTYVMSNNCLTGRFNYNGENGCFAEAFHRHKHGALGLIAATQVSYSFVNDVYVWGVYDNMWPNFLPTYGTEHATNFLLPAFGNAAGKYFLRSSSWTGDGVKEITYYLFHQHGDAYMNLYSEVPQPLDVEMLPVMAAGCNQYEIKADIGSTICLTANGQIIGFDEGTGEEQLITVTPQERGTRVKVTIKKQNYYRYEQEVAVISPEEPYIILHDVEINDSEGNANAEADYNETCKLNVSLHNAGFIGIENVSAHLTCAHPSVQILQGEAAYGDFSVNGINPVSDAFTIHFGDTIRDKENVLFHLQVTNGSISFTDSIVLTVNAPVFRYGALTMTDLEGNLTDRLLPGQSTLLTYDIVNDGHSNSLEQTHHLTLNAPFLSIAENPVMLPGIAAGDSTQVTFQVNVRDDAPDGNILDCSLYAESGSHTAVLEQQMPMGYTIESFDGDTLNPSLGWDLGSGAKEWTIVEDETAVGGHSLRSPSLGDRKKADMYVALTCHLNTTISFRHKTSTESNDLLIFSINNKEVESWSGESDWETSEIELKDGYNLLKFTFKKDAEGSAGEDCVWIDDLRLPPLEELILFAGHDSESCAQTPFTPNSYAYHQEDLLWSSNGDGSFDDDTAERPTYTFGPNDINNGEVVLSLTGTSLLNGLQQTAEVKVDITEDLTALGVLELATGDTLIDLRTMSQSEYVTAVDNNAECQWFLEPEEAGSIQSEGKQVTVVWNPEYRGMAQLGYKLVNECGESNDSELLGIRVLNTTGVEEQNSALLNVFPNPAKDHIRISANGLNSNRVLVRIIDSMGRIVMVLEKETTDSSLECSLDISKLHGGLYEVQVVDCDKLERNCLFLHAN